MIDFTSEVAPELWAQLLAAVEVSGLSFDEFLAMVLMQYLEDCDAN
jgi:hypothetical protein